MLGAVAAAWKHGDGEDAGLPLERLEAAAAEGLHTGKTCGQARAWAALDTTPGAEPNTAEAATQMRTPTAEPTSGSLCWA